jgi:hypothetical protein
VSPSGKSSLVQDLAARLAVPFLILAFVALFAYSSNRLQFVAAGYPRFLMVLLVPVLLIVILREISAALRARRHTVPLSSPDAQKGYEEQDGDGVPADTSQGWRDWIPSAALALWLVGFVAVLPQIGILWATAIFIPGVLITLGYRAWVWIAVITAATLLLIQLLFIRLFQIPLPGVW